MRYIIRDAHRDKVALAKEINYIANYIDIQKAKLRDAVLINYQLYVEKNHWKLPLYCCFLSLKTPLNTV